METLTTHRKVAKNMKKIVDTDVYKDLLAQRPALTWEITEVVIDQYRHFNTYLILGTCS